MKNKIFFLDLKKQFEEIKEEVFTSLKEVCENTAFSGGPYVEKFEKSFASYCDVNYCSGVNSGTSALHLAMLALNIKYGDEVIIPANTFIATPWAVSYVGATPVFTDCNPTTWNIDADKIEEKITERTKAIIGVHLYGQPFDIDRVKEIADKYKLYLVEDCAQAQGARYKGIKVGSFGEMGCFSFYPGKNLGACGEGGAVVTNNEGYDRRIKSLRNHGSTVRYYHDEIGFNMRMDGFQGAVLDIKLKYLDKWNEKRKVIAHKYRKRINNSLVKLQEQPEWSDSIYHLFVVTSEDRDGLKRHLEEQAIFPGFHYPVPCHLQKVYSHLGYKEGELPASEYLAKHCLSLPMYGELSDEEVDRVIDGINSFAG